MIRDDIKAAMIAAMKSGDKDTTQTLRLAAAAIKNRDIEARTGAVPQATTEAWPPKSWEMDHSAAITEIYRANARADRAEVEAEIAVIERFRR